MSIFSFFHKTPAKPQIVTKVVHVNNRYDALKFDPTRPVRDIRTNPTITEQWYPVDKRLKANAQADDLYDNDGVGSTVDLCIRLTIGSKGGTPRFTGDNREYYQRAFNRWKINCGFAEGEHYQDMLSMILRAVKVHGDCLILCDPDLTDGKLRVWDSDQICSIGLADFKKWCDERQITGWRTAEGVVMDEEGRTMGWFVTNLRNNYCVSISDATFLPATLARRVSYHKKISQIRGESSLISNADITNDTNALLKSEVQAAKNAAEMALVVIHGAGTSANPMIQALAAGGLTAEQMTEGTGVSVDSVQGLGNIQKSDSFYTAFQGKSAIGELENGASVTRLNNSDRPAASIQEWANNLADTNGRRLGVMSCLSRGRADNSYSSGQIEVEISFKQFEEDQKLLERQVVDYVCSVLYPDATYVVSWPKQFEIDPSKAETTKDAQIRGGRSTLQDQLGPDWQDVLLQQKEEMEFVKAHGLTTTPYLQQQAGAAPVLTTGAAPVANTEEHTNE